MIIIGEKINATRKAVAAALEARDAAYIRRIAAQQARAGAHYLDVNGGDPHEGREADNMAWLMETVQGSTDLPVAVDSASPHAVRVGLSMAARKPILNSISLEPARLESLLAVACQRECMVIALLVGEEGPPCGLDDRLRNADRLIGRITAAGKKLEEIIVDPCFFPVSADATCGRAVMESIAAIRRRWPGVHVGGGVSNVSFGLPLRRWLNLAALAQAIYHGMDAALVDPCAEGVVAMIHAAEAIAGADEMCMNYVTAARKGILGA